MLADRLLIGLGVAGAAWVASAAPASAALSAYDGFTQGAAGTGLLGQGGGTGFSGTWAAGGFNASSNANYVLGSGSLSFGNLATSGGRVTTASTSAIAGLYRPLASAMGIDGTTRYFSFLVRPEGTMNEGAAGGFFGLVLEQSGEPELYTGKGGNPARYLIENRGGPLEPAAPVTPVIGETAFLVVKAQFAAGNDTFTLYANPTPGGAEPSAGVVKNNADMGSVTGLTIYSTGAFSLDELRVGDTYADVTPVPEPHALALAGVIAGGLLARRRRARHT